MRLTTIISLMLYAVLSLAQPDKVIMKGISDNDLTLAEEHLSNWVFLSINNSSSTMRKSEAIQKLSDYLTIIQPTNYLTRHSGKANQNMLRYTVANLNSTEGKHRMFIYVDDIEVKVKEIRLSAVN